MLVKPVYEKPIDTAEDIIERGISILSYPGSEALVEIMKKSPITLTRKLAENTYVPKVRSLISLETHSMHFSLMIGLG